MEKYLNLSLLPILAGMVIGLIAGVVFIETSPPFLGWCFGIGMGLMGGAFVSAMASGDALVSGPKARKQNNAPWLDPPRDED